MVFAAFLGFPHRFAFSADASEDDVRRIMASNQHVYHMRNVTNASRLRDCARAMAETGTQLVGGNTGELPELFEDRTTLKGMRIVVTGATKGVGLACAWACALQGAEAVLMTSRGITVSPEDSQKLADHLGAEARRRGLPTHFIWQKSDARSTEDNEMTITKRAGLLGKPIHAIVLNAGVFGHTTGSHAIMDITKKQVDAVMSTNATGVLLGLQAFVRQLSDVKLDFSPSVVAIASIYGSSGSGFSHTAYQMSKGACKLAMKQAAMELARPTEGVPRVRCNSVSPTFLSTNLTKQFFENDEVKRILENDTPTGRWGEVGSVAATVAFLLSPAAESITGSDVPVDEGVLAESVPGVEASARIQALGDYRCCGTGAD